MEEFFDKLLWIPPFRDLTINRVLLSTSFRNLIFIVITMTFVIAALILKKRNQRTVVFKKALLAAFFISGLLYALQADRVWSNWFDGHAQMFFGFGMEDKLLRTEGEIYAFSRIAKQTISGEYEIFSSYNRKALRMEYFLLPLRKRERAPYIIIIDDRDVRYDPASRTFVHHGVSEKDIDLVLEFSGNGYILKRSL